MKKANAPTPEEATKAMTALRKLRDTFKSGRISYDNAKHFSEPYIATINAYMKSKARAAGVSFKPMSFTGFMR